MVLVGDEGTQFDASLDVAWKYLGSDDHGISHKGARNRYINQIDPRTMELTEENEMGGHWVKTTQRITLYPPLRMSTELLDGPMGESKFFTYYQSMGHVTEVGVVGDFVSTQIPPAPLEGAVRQVLERFYEEDRAAIRAFAAKK